MQTKSLGKRLAKALPTLMLATTLAACGTGPSGGANIKGIVDASVTTACGKTPEDQRKIDRTTESGFRAGVWDRPKFSNC